MSNRLGTVLSLPRTDNSRSVHHIESGIGAWHISNGNPCLACLNKISKHRPLPKSITVDNGSEFAGRAIDTWEYQNGVKLDLIRPGKPVEKAFIESFNGRIHDEFFYKEELLDIADARKKLEEWRNDYNYIRLQCALEDLSSVDFASTL